MRTLVTLIALAAPAADDAPPAVPATRPAMKEALEASKENAPRLPLPPLTPEEEAKASQGDWGVVNNGRMRKHYLPPVLLGSGFARNDPGMTLGYPFQTMLFWIVSRANNCTYCMGHQESKLAAAGVGEATVAALDGDWAEFTPAERAAFDLARKLTFEPDAIDDADLDALRPHYNDAQIAEILVVVGNFNAMNRWTGALRIPQEGHRVYLTETDASIRDRLSRVAPLDPEGTAPRRSDRPALESRAEVEAALAACRARRPRLELIPEAEARKVASPAEGPLPAWVRLLARFPEAGGQRIAVHRAAESAGVLDPKLRAQIAWIAARHDRAWYALALAKRRLESLGFTDDQIYTLDEDDASFAPAERAAFGLARTLTTDPALVTDADVAAVRAHFSDRETAEIIWHVTEAAFFDRVTEAAGLAIED